MFSEHTRTLLEIIAECDAEPTLTAAQLAARLRARAGGKCEEQPAMDSGYVRALRDCIAIINAAVDDRRARADYVAAGPRAILAFSSRCIDAIVKLAPPSPQPATAGDVERWHASTATHTDEAHVEVIARLVPALRKKIEDRERGDNFSDVFPTWQVTALLDEINRLRALVRP